MASNHLSADEAKRMIIEDIFGDDMDSGEDDEDKFSILSRLVKSRLLIGESCIWVQFQPRSSNCS